jgi:hypothetical protein
MRRKDGGKKQNVNIPKLDDANHAGGRNGASCTLILTEGEPPTLPPARLSTMRCSTVLGWPYSTLLSDIQLAAFAQVQSDRPNLSLRAHARTGSVFTAALSWGTGDSAKALAVSGLGVVGRDKYGVFPLRGKLLNVREANHKQVMENAEISAIKKILGLQVRSSFAPLRARQTHGMENLM